MMPQFNDTPILCYSNFNMSIIQSKFNFLPANFKREGFYFSTELLKKNNIRFFRAYDVQENKYLNVTPLSRVSAGEVHGSTGSTIRA